MKNIKTDHEKWLYILPFVTFWLLLIQISGTATIISAETLKKIPSAAMYAGIFYYLFSKYIWRWSFLQQWLIPYPNLEGTWTGVLQSTWENPETKKPVETIPVQFCIHQDFENLHISMFTKESESFSQAARFITENDGSIGLKYTYTNKPKAVVRHKSEIHEGAASLKIVRTPQLALTGQYWTDRETTGDIVLKKKSNELIDCFRDDLI